ncbi:MAG: alpha/beta hydrolase [Caulobacteraceae bacterium]|nr:alpha/beta hydrolase [Caulobacter sp.]
MSGRPEVDVLGQGPDALLLPALSSVATRREMRPLAERLMVRLRCLMADWPGFGMPSGGRPLSPILMTDFLSEAPQRLALTTPILGIAAGHGATMMVLDALCHPERYRGLVLVAPTWRGPLPTMTGGDRPSFCRAVRRALEAPVLGPALFAANLSRPVVGWMLREHVYADPRAVTPALVAEKHAVARRAGARRATAAFVSGGLDPVASREAFLALFDERLPPVLLVRPRGAPRRSAAEMDALAASGRVRVAVVSGALGAHEESPGEVADAVAAFLDSL